MIRSCWYFLSKHWISSWASVSNCVSQLRLALNPCWQSVSISCSSRCMVTLLVRTGEGDRSVVPCFVLLPFYKDGSDISCSTVLWYYPSVKNLLEYDGQSLWPSP